MTVAAARARAGYLHWNSFMRVWRDREHQLRNYSRVRFCAPQSKHCGRQRGWGCETNGVSLRTWCKYYACLVSTLIFTMGLICTLFLLRRKRWEEVIPLLCIVQLYVNIWQGFIYSHTTDAYCCDQFVCRNPRLCHCHPLMYMNGAFPFYIRYFRWRRRSVAE